MFKWTARKKGKPLTGGILFHISPTPAQDCSAPRLSYCTHPDFCSFALKDAYPRSFHSKCLPKVHVLKALQRGTSRSRAEHGLPPWRWTVSETPLPFLAMKWAALPYFKSCCGLTTGLRPIALWSKHIVFLFTNRLYLSR